jgi:tetratricopeptide (TPR) repeat protein
VGYLRRAVELKSDVAEFHLGLGAALVKLGELKEGEGCLRQVLQFPTSSIPTASLSEAYYFLGVIKSEQQQGAEAVDWYRRGWEIHPGSVDCGLALAKALGQLGRWDEAVDWYRQVVALSESGEVVFRLGQALAELGRWEEAIAEYQGAIALGFAGAEVRHHLGYAFSQLGRYEEAVVEFRQVLEVNPKSAQVRHQLGYGLMRLQRWREAALELRKAVELYPRSAVVWQQLGDVLRELGENEEAEEAYQQGVKVQGDRYVNSMVPPELPLESSTLFQQAQLATQKNEWSEAARCWCKLWKTDGDSLPPQTMVFISNELFKLDAFSEAASCLERLLAIHPDYPGALREQKNQYCYHAYSSWLMETVEGISDWYKADGLLTRPDWNTAVKLCKRFIKTDDNKNSPAAIRQYVRTLLLLAEEYWELQDSNNARIVLQDAIDSFGKSLPLSLINSTITSIETIRVNQANSREELTQNIKSQILTIDADVLSVNNWLSLYDVLNWNGLFEGGFVARQKAVEKAYHWGDAQPNNITALMVAVRAAIDQGDFTGANRFINRLAKTNCNSQQLSELRAYKYLQEGDIEGFRNYWPYPARLADLHFQEYIRGKSVAIVSPAPTGMLDGEEIDSFDVVIRFNYRGEGSIGDAREYGSKTNISLYNAHTIRYFVAHNQLDILSNLDFSLIRRPRHDVDALGWDKKRIRLIYETDNIFYKSLNGAPAVLFDVLLQGADKVKLFKTNFYLTSQHHSEKYRGRDESSFAEFPLRKIQPVVANHDLVSQVGFTRSLWKAGLIDVDDQCGELLDYSNESYLGKLNRLIYNYNVSVNERNLVDTLSYYKNLLDGRLDLQEAEIDNHIFSYNRQIATSKNSIDNNHHTHSTKVRYKRLIFVIMSVPHKILTLLSLLRFQQQQKEYEHCEDYLLLAGGNPQGVKILLDIAKIWKFKQVINIGNLYKFLRSNASYESLNVQVAQELIKNQIGLDSVDVVYHWSPTDDLIWSLYPQARKICFGDALGILKKHSITRRFNPSDSLVVDEAYLLAPYEETEGMFNKCPISIIDPQCYQLVVKDSAKIVKGLVEYCSNIKQKANSSIVLIPTSYFAQSPEVKDFNKEIDIYLSYALEYTSKEDTIVIKAHPTLKAQKQSRVLVEKLEKNERKCIEISDNFDDVPLEFFAVLLNPKRVLSVLSTCAISIAYLCKCEIVLGLDESIIAGFKNNTVNNADWNLKQKVIYLQTKQAYQNIFSPITHVDVAGNQKFPTFPVLMKLENTKVKEINHVKFPVEANFIINRNLRHSAWLSCKLGEHYISLGNYNDGALELQKATNLDPSSSWFYYNLGKALASSGKTSDARKAYLRATELSFDSHLRQSLLHRQQNEESNLRGLVAINSMGHPPLGMNKSIQIVAPYLVRDHGIHLEYALSNLDDLLATIANKLHWYDFIIFNSLASISSWNYPDVARLITKLNIPVFVYWHETDWTLRQWKESCPVAVRSIMDISSHRNFTHLTVSEVGSEAIRKYFPNSKNIHKIYECTDIPQIFQDATKSIHKADPFVLNIASIQERKGTDLFIDTAIKVCDRHSTVKFIWLGKVVSGGEELYQKCQSKIKSRGLENRILFPGYVESPWEFYLRNASVFFLSSRDDPFPLSMLEAMCTGRNIVAFNTGGTPEAVGKYGIIVDSFDIDGAAQAIIDLLTKSSDDWVNKYLIERYNSLYTPKMLALRIAKIVKSCF